MNTLLSICLVALAIAFAVALLRVAIGPSVADRAAAADVALFIVVSALILFAVRTGSDAAVDIVLIATLLSFVASIALARLIRRPGEDR